MPSCVVVSVTHAFCQPCMCLILHFMRNSVFILQRGNFYLCFVISQKMCSNFRENISLKLENATR